MIVYEDGVAIVYCDCCGKECLDGYENIDGMDICPNCINENNLCNFE